MNVQTLNPSRYEWLEEEEAEEDLERAARGKRPKRRKLKPAVEQFRMNRHRIEYAQNTPFSLLARKEIVVRKLLAKFCDPLLTTQEKEEKEGKAELAAKGEVKALVKGASFDPHLAERTRAKNLALYGKEENEWMLIDKILHPEVWVVSMYSSIRILVYIQNDMQVGAHICITICIYT